jgi:hypothetical protein
VQCAYPYHNFKSKGEMHLVYLEIDMKRVKKKPQTLEMKDGHMEGSIDEGEIIFAKL